MLISLLISWITITIVSCSFNVFPVDESICRKSVISDSIQQWNSSQLFKYPPYLAASSHNFLGTSGVTAGSRVSFLLVQSKENDASISPCSESIRNLAAERMREILTKINVISK